MKRHAVLLMAVTLCVAAGVARGEDEALLAPAPIRPYAWLEEPTAGRLPLKGGLAVDTQNRNAVASFYYAHYTAALAVPIAWTGSIVGCVAGTTSQAYIDATFQILNYFRAMTGLPGNITNNASLNPGAQQAALMMIAEGALSHSPGPTWACYTSAGASAAASSNLALGVAGPDAIDLYMLDRGTFNTPVGHRRWLLYPPRAQMGTGSNDGVNFFRGANALRVFGATTTRPASPTAVTWPPAGYVPYQVVYARWSLSLNSTPGADYTSATVTMTEGGTNVPLTVVSDDNTSFGDNTIVWEPSGLFFGPGPDDRTIDVTVANIGGSPSSVSYQVTVFDPSTVPPGQIFADGFESGDTAAWN